MIGYYFLESVTMRNLNAFDFTDIKRFIQAAFDKSVELGAFVDTGFSVDSFMKRVMDNGFEPTYLYKKSQSKNFERITYTPAYRRNSSSGKIAKTSIVYYRFDTEFMSIQEGKKELYTGHFLRLCWPVHLMNKKDLWFNLDTGEIWLTYRHPDDIRENHKKVTVEDLLNLFYVETMGSIHYIINKKTKVGMTKKAFFKLPSETIRDHLKLCEMLEV